MEWLRRWIMQAAYDGAHQAITEHVTADKVKRKLNISNENQLEMFAAEKARAVAIQNNSLASGFAKAKRATNRI